MSVTKEEAITILQHLAEIISSGDYQETFKMAASALRPITREQVEKVWRGEWKCQSDCGVTECTACKWNIEEYCGDYNFCPHCGAPMNDEAIQMVMERMEALKDE